MNKPPPPLPQDFALTETDAFRLLSEGQYREAEHLCMAMVERAPQNSRAHYLLGLAFYFMGQREKALEKFTRAIALNPDELGALYNTGACSLELRKYDEAIAAYQAVLSKAPDDPEVLNNLGRALLATGRYDDSLACFRRTLSLDPYHRWAALNILVAECRCLPMTAWADRCHAAFAWTGLSPENRYIVLIYRAIAEWATGNIAALTLTLQMASGSRPEAMTEDLKNFILYEIFLTKLLHYRNNNQQLYVGADKPVFLVGDSHSLSYAGIHIPLDGVDHKIFSHLIIGAKAWNLNSQRPNQYSVALDYYMSRLPEGATLMCAFGEIDCRFDSGILPYWRKTGGDLEVIVAEQVKSYVAVLTARAARQSLKLIFLSVPAPCRSGGDRRDLIQIFNRELQKYVADAGHQYTDLYASTLGTDGFSDENLHIDDFHLKPEALTVVYPS